MGPIPKNLIIDPHYLSKYIINPKFNYFNTLILLNFLYYSKMKAVQITEKKKIEIIKVPEPKLKDNCALIDIKAIGICGSDIHAFTGQSKNVVYPNRIGHEAAGVVIEISKDAYNPNGIKVGDRVVINPYIFCGECYPCSQGKTNCCIKLKCIGVQSEGAMTEKFVHPVELLVKVPDSVDWETCAIIEPAVIALHALNNINMKPGEHVVITRCGCIGMLIAILAIAKGGIPIMIDKHKDRLDKAKSFGVKYIINTSEQDPIKEINKITNGRMAECVCEVAGKADEVRKTLNYVANTGRIELTGWVFEDVPIPTGLLTYKELHIMGSRTGRLDEFVEVLDLVSSGKVNIKQIISKKVSLEKIPEAIIDFEVHPGTNLKVIALR